MGKKRRGGRKGAWALTRRLNPTAAAALLEVLRRVTPGGKDASEIPSSSGVRVSVVTKTPPPARGGWTRRPLPASAVKSKPVAKPATVGRRWLLVPTSLRTLPRTDRLILRIEPGAAFGSGEHETTRLCLRLIEATAPGRSFLDVGTGSGILAIAALLRGFRWAIGMDPDAAALRAARINARFNGCSERLRLRRASLESWTPPGRFDAIAANLLAGLLSAQAGRLASWLAPGGALVVSGVLRSQEKEVADSMHGAKLIPTARLTEGKWLALAFAARVR
ncbi:MAG: 50S ribosomal protein L11 methyltransferase [Verrucomicrobiae bacterium]|nr:50S ribosomal protein L11 methyltransferase [Verrucomicrobiae bacterium]